mgnify:CR=1 FL=1
MPPPSREAARHGIAYRPMTDADLAFVAALFASTRAEELAATGWPADVQHAFLAQQHHAQHVDYARCFPDAERLIVERAGEPIGRLYLGADGDGLRIIDISLLPAERGRGLGGAILVDVIAAAEAAGRTVSIHVEKTNPARRLYERLGFLLVEDRGLYDLMERRPGGPPGADQ